MNDAPLSGRRALDSISRPVRGGRSFKWACLLGVAVLTLISTGCATKGDIRSLRTEVRTLAEQQAEMLDALQALERFQQSSLDSLGTMSDVLFTLRGELNRQVLEIQEQLVTVQELTGQSQRSLAGLRDQIEARRTAITQQGTPAPSDGGGGGAGAQPQSQGAGGQAQAGGGGAQQAAGGGAADAQELFTVAVSQYNRGSVTTARTAFERFLNSYPSHRLAPDAHFYLAEIMAQENQLDEALEAFLDIPELFPAADRVPQALYRAGRIHEELGSTDDARALYQRVVNSYPDSGAAILSDERLEALP